MFIHLSNIIIQIISYLYDASGNKLKKSYDPLTGPTVDSYYQGSVLLTGGKVIVMNGEGRSVKNSTSWDYEYDLKDHLGNTRISFLADNGQVSVLQVKDYYPFGMEMTNGQSVAGDPTKYLYNGKELQDEAGLDFYDYGARFYDPIIGRWHSVDDAAERGYFISPYAYTFNNPIKYIDPDGNWPWEQKSVRQARHFAGATGGRFEKHSGSYRRNYGTAATVYLHGTADGLNVRQSYAEQTGQGYGSSMSPEDQNNAQTVEFENGGDYSSYFGPPEVILANGAATVGIALEEVLIAFPQVASLLSGNESVNADNVAADQVKQMGKAKQKALARGNHKSQKKVTSAEADYGSDSAEHTTNQSPSNKNKHERGRKKYNQDRGGEKADTKRERYK